MWRPAGDGIEICVVHRPYRSDWSLPKGKLDGAEHTLVAAVREVLEETGVAARPQLRLPEVAYTLPDGRPKTVDFWLMRAGDGPAVDPVDADEVDEVLWLSPEAAQEKLTYADERRVAAHAAGFPRDIDTTLLIRHAHAGKRKDFAGDDNLRPVDERGRAQAERIAAAAALFAPERLLAATPVRCRQTLEPLAERLGLPVVEDPVFAEPREGDLAPEAVKEAADRLRELRGEGTVAVCSQGKVIPRALAQLYWAGETGPGDHKTPKGVGWVLSWSDGVLFRLSRI